MENKRGSFGSKFGVVAAVAGSAVGLGNIWRFPYIAGENGGAVFIIVYLLICLLIAIPVMISEFAIGRHGRKNVMGSMRQVAKGKMWLSLGYLGVFAAVLILSFYSVIAGWTLNFIVESVKGFSGMDVTALTANFNGFVNSNEPIVWTLLFLALTAVIVLCGVEKGIERSSKIMMPMLVLMLLGMSIYSLFLPGFGEAFRFLFKPDFSKMTWDVVLQALGQSFFSMSVGMGTMITYGSYIKDKENLYGVGATVALSDVLIAFLAGVAIFPAVFTFGIAPTSGSELVFLTLPSVFSQIPAGQLLSFVFFVLLFFAAITSAISLLEVPVAYLTEEFNIKRKRAVVMGFVVIGALSVFCTLSLQDGSSLVVGGDSLFDFFDKFTSNIMLPVGGILVSVFVGWFMDKKLRYDQFTNQGQCAVKLYKFLVFLVKFVVPVAISILFISKNLF